QTVVVVGVSGSGKIISLIERFYDPVAGQLNGKGEDKKHKLTRIKELDELEKRINNVEAFFSKVIIISDDDTSLDAPVFSDSDSSKDSHDYLLEDSSKDLINFLAGHDPQWQFPKQTQKEEPKPLDVPMQTKEEEPMPLDVPMRRLRKKTPCHLISSTHIQKFLQVLGLQKQKLDVLVLEERETLKFCAQDKSFGWSILTL
ncbi:hypothetical protein Tco_0915658, partial [Tanacetum coccineum]